MYIIYKTTNSVNGKIYVGLHKQDGTEFDGYLGSGFLLKKAIAKYGKAVFSRVTLAMCDTKEVAAVTEKALIEQYDSRNPLVGYNITEGGIGGDVIANHPNRDEIIQKLKVAVRRRIDEGTWVNPAEHPGAREKQQASQQRYFAAHPEHWDRLKGERTEEQMNVRLEAFNKNKEAGLHQDQTITSANISASQKKRFAERPETHGMLGSFHTEDSRAKISQTRKERLAAGLIVPVKVNLELISGENNYQFKGWFVTPWGRFASIKAAVTDDNAGITDSTTLRKLFNNINDTASTRSARVFHGTTGDTWSQLGFAFVPA